MAGVLRAAVAYADGSPIDEVDLALSLVGLAAVALVPITGGTSATVKVGAGLGRTAWRAGLLAPELAAPLVRAAREGVDWARLPVAVRGGDLRAAVRPAVMRPAMSLAGDAGRLLSATDTPHALLLLARADTPAELRCMANGAEVLGPRAAGRMEVLGKPRFLRATMRWANEVWALVAGLMAALGMLASALGSAIASGLLRALRRTARGPTRS